LIGSASLCQRWYQPAEIGMSRIRGTTRDIVDHPHYCQMKGAPKSLAAATQKSLEQKGQFLQQR
jgi:hypothetical protein